MGSWLNYEDPSGNRSSELAGMFSEQGRAFLEWESSKILGYYSSAITALLNLGKPVALTFAGVAALISMDSDILIDVWDTYEQEEERAIENLANLAGDKTAFYLGRCEGDSIIILFSGVAAIKGASGAVAGAGALVAEGASGIGVAVIPETAVYTIANVGVAILGAELVLTTSKTLGEDIVRLSDEQLTNNVNPEQYEFKEGVDKDLRGGKETFQEALEEAFQKQEPQRKSLL